MLSISSRLSLCYLTAAAALFCCLNACLPALAQSLPAGDAARINPSILPTDSTPLIFTGERGLLSRELKFSLLKRLPERLWFSTSTEASQRLETNPFFKRSDAKPDYVFRALPNITVGYNVLKNTGIYCNYFVIKDVFARFPQAGRPINQSLSLGVRHSIAISNKTSAQFDFQARELWQAAGIRQADLLPSVSITHIVTPRVVLFASTVLQLRGRNYFVAPTREIDPFYSAGMLLRKGQWNFLVTDTFVTNFRHPPFSNPVPRQGNVSMIADFEINHPVNNRYLPGVLAFVRAEPVWNWRSNGVTGLSGFDFRLFSGIRISVSKPAYNSTIDKMRQQVIDYDQKLKSLPRAAPAGQVAPGSQIQSKPAKPLLHHAPSNSQSPSQSQSAPTQDPLLRQSPANTLPQPAPNQIPQQAGAPAAVLPQSTPLDRPLLRQVPTGEVPSAPTPLSQEEQTAAFSS